MASTRPLSAALAQAALQQLQETPGRLEENLQLLREWLEKQPHLRARMDDQFLASFIRGCKFSLERAKEKVDGYYTQRTALPDVFSNRDPTGLDVLRVLKCGIFLPLGEDAEGRRVILVRSCAYDTSQVTANDLFKVIMMILDVLMMEDDAFVINGLVGVLDFAGMTIAHATHVSPSLAKKSMNLFQDAYPLRPRALHYLNLSSVFEKLFKLFKSFMKEKLQQRLFIHSDFASMYATVPREVLPQEYGGSAGTLQEITDRWTAKLAEYREFFTEEDRYGVDESKRLGKPKGQRDAFGVDGSFRTLNVD